MDLEEIRLQLDRGLKADHRHRFVAQAVENVAEQAMGALVAGVEADGGHERPDRLLHPPGRPQSEAKVMVVRSYSWIELDRPLQQPDRLDGASALDQTPAV